VFSPVHASVRHVAQAVDAFVRQGESVLTQSSAGVKAASGGCAANIHNQLLVHVCNSPNEAALALQALPLLHLAGSSIICLSSR
jgi:hypothetical protein